MDISTAMKLIELGFSTEQIKNFETTPSSESPIVTDREEAIPEPTVEAPTPAVVEPVKEPIDYKKLAEEVALYNQRNSIIPPEPKAEVKETVIPPTDSKTEAANAILGFLG